MKVRQLRRYHQSKMARGFLLTHLIWDDAYKLDASLRAKRTAKDWFNSVIFGSDATPVFFPLELKKTPMSKPFWEDPEALKAAQAAIMDSFDPRQFKTARATIVQIPKSLEDGAYLLEQGLGGTAKVLLLGGMPTALNTRRLDQEQLMRFLTQGAPVLVHCERSAGCTDSEAILAQVEEVQKKHRPFSHDFDVGMSAIIDPEGSLTLRGWNLINPENK